MKLDVKSEVNNTSKIAIKVFDKERESEAYKLCVKGDALRLANLHQESVGKYLQSIMIKRENPDSYYGLGVSYKYLGNYNKAIENLSKAVVQDVRKFDAFYELGICYLLSGTPELAIKPLKQAIVINPDNAEAQIQLALAHELVGEESLAMLIYDKLIETNPGYIKAYSHKAALLICNGKYYDASKIFFNIIKLNANYHKAYLGIGVCFENMDKLPEAKRYYKKFLEMKPDSKHADFVTSKLENIRKKYTTQPNSRLYKLINS